MGRFLAAWLTGRAGVTTRPVQLRVAGRSVAGDLYHPQGHGDPLPAWIVLHGLTRPGPRHRSLAHFVTALAATPALVLVPDIPRWRALELAPEATDETVKGALDFLDGRPEALPGGAVLAGFSFGAPQALRVAGAPSLRERVNGVVAWGGYHDLVRTIAFQLTGDFRGQEPDGTAAEGHVEPDAYARWVVAGNCLPLAFPDAGDVARALLRLARAAGDRQVPSDSPRVHPLVATHRTGVAAHRRHLYDLFAPPRGGLPDPEGAHRVVQALDGPVRRAFPLLDPGPHLGPLSCPVRLLHARSDRMIPFTETVELARAVEGTPDREVTVTGLFGHSGHGGPRFLPGLAEGKRFLRALNGVLGLGRQPTPRR